jgi:hypothetical protein
MAKKQDPEVARKRRVLIFSLIMVFLMVFSFASIIVVNDSGSLQKSYGNYEFGMRDMGQGRGVYTLQLNGQELEFQNLPIQVGFLAVDPTAVQLMKNAQTIVLAADPNASIDNAMTVDYARFQLTLALGKTSSALTMLDERFTLPVVNCSMASPMQPVMIFNISNASTVTTQGSCILVNAENAEILRFKDRLIFEYYDIMTNGVPLD